MRTIHFRLPDVLHNLNKKDRQIGPKHWNPPLLGPLPNDFLRLTVNCNVQVNSVLYKQVRQLNEINYYRFQKASLMMSK